MQALKRHKGVCLLLHRSGVLVSTSPRLMLVCTPQGAGNVPVLIQTQDDHQCCILSYLRSQQMKPKYCIHHDLNIYKMYSVILFTYIAGISSLFYYFACDLIYFSKYRIIFYCTTRFTCICIDAKIGNRIQRKIRIYVTF